MLTPTVRARILPRVLPIDGEAATITVGAVSTLPPGGQATVVNVGTSNAAILNFALPQGATGNDGEDGDMAKSTYDPTNINASAFDRANHTGTQLANTISNFSTAADARISAAIGSTVQAYDAELAAVAGLTSAADKGIYFTGAGTAATYDVTSVARTLVAQTSQALMRTTGLGMSANGSSLVSAADYAAMRTLLGLVIGTNVQAYDAQLFSGVPQNSQSGAYTLVLTDANKHILHPSADTTARIFTIPANSSVAFPIGTAVTFVNQNGAGVITIAITTDTMRLSPGGTTGSRTLAANGMATAIKVTATDWMISGSGLT